MITGDVIRRLTRLERLIDGLIKPEVGRWGDWTPTVTQSGAVTVTVSRARYMADGNTVHIYVELSVTGTGTAGNAITIGGIPAAVQPVIVNGSDVSPLGTASVIDQGTQAYYGFLVASTAASWHIMDSNTRGQIGVNPSFALANTDIIAFRATYERA